MFLSSVVRIHAPEHLPVGVTGGNNAVDRSRLNEWWTMRSIPAGRSGIREALDTLGITDTKFHVFHILLHGIKKHRTASVKILQMKIQSL